MSTNYKDNNHKKDEIDRVDADVSESCPIAGGCTYRGRQRDSKYKYGWNEPKEGKGVYNQLGSSNKGVAPMIASSKHSRP